VEDVPSTGPKDWAVLWQENDYRRQPILEGGVGMEYMDGASYCAVPQVDRPQANFPQ